MLDKDLCRTAEIEILRHLKRHGFRVHLIASYSAERYQGDEVNFPVWSVPLREAPIIRPLFFAAVLFLLLPIFALLEKPDFIITTPGVLTIPHFLWKPMLSRCLRTKVILDIRSTPVEVQGLRGALQAHVFRVSVLLASKAFDGVTIVTDLMREEILRSFHLDPASVGVWTNGVSTELFDPATYVNEALQLRKELDLLGKIVVLYHGVLTHKRGIIEAVKGMSKLMCNDIVLLLLGNGPALPAIEAAIHECGLQKKVIVHEPVKYTEVPKYIAMSDPDWSQRQTYHIGDIKMR